jgi:hypothetical protein
LSRNTRLQDEVQTLEASTAARYARNSGHKVRRFKSFAYAAGSWSKPRRAVARVEVSSRGRDTRYIVTNLDGVRGDCDVEGAYDNDEGFVPDIEITLVDPGGNEIDLDRSFGEVVYDAAGFRGVALRSVDIEEIDDHVLRAESNADDVVVIAVGRDPGEGVAVLRASAIAAAWIGLLAGLALLLVGARRSATTRRGGFGAGRW